jgi:alkylhydroperoxidase family enzyme
MAILSTIKGHMSAFISLPQKIPFYLQIGIWVSKKIVGKDMLPARLLAWYPKAAVGSGVLEALVAHKDGNLDERILKIVRMQASFSVACPFCIDMNSYQYEDTHISQEEWLALKSGKDPESIETFSRREKLAIQYAKLVSQTPLKFPMPFIDDLKKQFSEREIVILATTAAQVNYWARLIQALGIPPAGFINS